MSRLMLFRLVAGKGIAIPGRASSQSAGLAHLYSSNDGQILSNNARQSISQQNVFSMNGLRNIYSESSLKLDTLDRFRQNKGRIFDSGKERYIERVRKYIEEGKIQSVVKEDFINVVGLAETEQHLDLIEQMIVSPSMKDLLVDGPWGSVLMRLYYRLNQIDRAYNNIKNTEKFGGFFMQYASIRVFMTMLFKAGRFDEVLEIYNLADEKLGRVHPRSQRQVDLLALATCVKIKTPESFSIAENIYTKSISLDHRHLLTRLESIFVYMAIIMNEPGKALNYLTGDRTRNNIYLPVNALKTVAMLKLDRFEDIVFSLREAIEWVKPLQINSKILPREVAEMVRAREGDIEDENVRLEMMDILVDLDDNNRLDDRSLESILFNEIDTSEGNQLEVMTKRKEEAEEAPGLRGKRNNLRKNDTWPKLNVNRGWR